MFFSELEDTQKRVEFTLREELSGFNQVIAEPMLYACKGGKCFRAFLVLQSARLHGVSSKEAIRVATAVEAIHAYSLVHDDLPCMDDDKLRRGHPTVHVKWNEATAVLTGDALQALAFEVLASKNTSNDPEICLSLIRELSIAIGATGMILGQMLDIEAEKANEPLDYESIVGLQMKKTGALIECSAKVGPIMAKEDSTSMSKYARLLGLAYQITDDILDVEGEFERVGKKLNKDFKAGKATFVNLLGLEGAKLRASVLIEEAIDTISSYPNGTVGLKAAAQFVISRDL